MIFQESGRELPPASTIPTPDISSSGSCPETSTSDLSSLERMLSRLFPLEDLNATSLEPSSIISLGDSVESETPDTSWGGKDAPPFLSNASVCPKVNNATMPSLPSTSVRRSVSHSRCYSEPCKLWCLLFSLWWFDQHSLPKPALTFLSEILPFEDWGSFQVLMWRLAVPHQRLRLSSLSPWTFPNSQTRGRP